MSQPPSDERAREAALDAGLVARAQRGDRSAFNALVERYQSLAYALALRMLGEPETAADVTQEAFFAAYRAIASCRGPSFRSWLLRIVSNGCYDVYRARGRHPSTSLEELIEQPGAASDAQLPETLVDATWDPEGVALRGETVAALQAALLALGPEQRLAVILSDVHGMPYDEIARIMETPVGTVKSRIARARGQLRAILGKQRELFPRVERPTTGSS